MGNKLKKQRINTFSDVTQIRSIIVSFISLSLSSTKLYYLQRIRKFFDAEASIKMSLYILPAIMCQLLMPLFSLIVITGYLKAWVLLVIILIIVADAFGMMPSQLEKFNGYDQKWKNDKGTRFSCCKTKLCYQV
jgi:ABC-type glycerol-3-phosphate transport system permease component